MARLNDEHGDEAGLLVWPLDWTCVSQAGYVESHGGICPNSNGSLVFSDNADPPGGSRE